MDGRLSPLQRLVRDTARRFAAEKLRAKASAPAPAPQVDELAQLYCDLGLNLVDLPPDLGGAGLGPLTSALVHEALAAGDVNVAFAIARPGAFVSLVARLGDAVQRERYLKDFARNPLTTRGAVAMAPNKTLLATQEEHGFRLRGELSGVWHLSDADRLALVVDDVKSSTGPEAVQVVLVLDGELLARARKASVTLDGLSLSQVGALQLDDLVVPHAQCLAHGALLPALGAMFAAESVRMASLALGTARAASSYVLAFAEERRQSGHPLAHFQSMGFLLIDIELACREALGRLTLAAGAAEEALTAQLMPGRGRERLDEDLQEAIEVARQRADEVAYFVTDSALQILDDGHVDVSQHPLLAWHEDVKVLSRCYHWPSYAPAATGATSAEAHALGLLC